MVVHLLDEQSLTERFPRQRTPARALHGPGRAGELLAELVERPEVLVDRAGQFAFGPIASVRSQVLPEERVQHMTAQVERERLLETDEGAHVAGIA